MQEITAVLAAIFYTVIAACIGYIFGASDFHDKCKQGSPIVISNNVYQCEKKEIQ